MVETALMREWRKADEAAKSEADCEHDPEYHPVERALICQKCWKVIKPVDGD